MSRMQLVGDDVGEERQLIAPALHVLVANGRLRERVREPETRGAGVLLEHDRDERTTRRERHAFRVTVGEHQSLGRNDLDDFADGFGAARDIG